MEYKSFYNVLWGVLGLVFWSLSYWNVGKKAQLFLAGTKSKGVFYKKFILFIVGVLGWLLISYSLTNPRKPLSYNPSSIEVNDIYLVVDVSRSMLAEDLKPNRLEVAKEKLREFARLRPTDRIGVIMFSEKVFTLLPLTVDPSLIDSIISEINVGFLGSGTNIGDALALAVARGIDSKTKNKVVVLLTDGVSNVGTMTPIEAAKIAQENNIKVYTIGLGSSEDARIPIGNSIFGQQYQRIPGGSIDTKTLENISKMTGGKSFLAGSKKSLENILTEIQKLEKTKIDSQSQIIYKELFYKYLAAGILMLLLSDLLRKFVLREVE